MLKRFRLLKEQTFPCLWKLKHLQCHRRNKFVCARISFPSDAADLRCRVTPSLIGLKRNDSYSPRSIAAEQWKVQLLIWRRLCENASQRFEMNKAGATRQNTSPDCA